MRIMFIPRIRTVPLAWCMLMLHWSTVTSLMCSRSTAVVSCLFSSISREDWKTHDTNWSLSHEDVDYEVSCWEICGRHGGQPEEADTLGVPAPEDVRITLAAVRAWSRQAKEMVTFLVEKLARELPRQYESPQDLSIFGNEIAFRDPVTDLRGKGNYRRMLVSVMLFFRLVCKPSSAYFKLVSIERSGDDKIRTVWETGATTWTGRELFISGVDFFTVEENGRISRHDSEWDQSWEEVRSQVL